MADTMLRVDMIIHKGKAVKDDNILSERESYVRTGHVEFCEIPNVRGPCSNPNADSHKGCPYINHFMLYCSFRTKDIDIISRK